MVVIFIYTISELSIVCLSIVAMVLVIMNRSKKMSIVCDSVILI